MSKFIGFMAHMPLEDYDEIETELINYIDIEEGQYLIGHESEPYSHYHFYCEMSLDAYHNFSKHLFKDKYKLRGRVKDGLPRQYGKIKNIRDQAGLASYTIKDKNFRSNMPEDQVKSIFEKSFKKETLKLLKDKMLIYVEEDLQSHKSFDKLVDGKLYCYKSSHDSQAKDAIVKFCLETDVDITASKLKMFFNYWLTKTKYLEPVDKIAQIRTFNYFI